MMILGDNQRPVRQGEDIVIAAPVLQGIAGPGGVVVDHHAMVHALGAIADRGAKLRQAVAGEVGKVDAPDRRTAVEAKRLLFRDSLHKLRPPAEGDAGEGIQVDLPQAVPAEGIALELVKPQLRRTEVPRVLGRGGVGQQGHGCRDADRRCRRDNPAGRLFPPGQMANPPGRVPGAEGQGQAHPPSGGQLQQRGGVVRPGGAVHPPHHGLVAGGLHILPGQREGQPDQGVEPVEGQRREGQGLPPGVAPAEVAALMAQDVLPRLGWQRGGQIDLRPRQPQDKGRGNPLGQIDAPLQGHGGAELAAQPKIGYPSPQGHGSHPGQPDRPGHSPGVGGRSLRCGVRRLFRRCRSRRLFHRTGGHEVRQRGNVGHGGGRIPGLHRRGVQQAEERHGGRKRHWAQKAQQHHSPQGADDGPGRPPEGQPQQRHRRDDHAGRQAHVHHPGKDSLNRHGRPSPSDR